MGTIRRLPPEVVNRMAAGEVLARPSNAIKELVENSLDAGSTEIVVNIQNGGLKSLQVMDNGKGICRDDFELVCERFATSKLKEFEDLMKMKTYGFRGEALASLSHVSKVNIVSKQADATCAYQANFLDGKMVAATRPAAGKTGTCITATELFYNLPQRRNKMLSSNEESRLIFDTLMRFAIHRPDVSFALRQNQSSDFRTKGDGNFRDVVSCLVGRQIADNLIQLQLDSNRLKFKFSGCMSMPISAATAKLAQNRKTKQSFFSVFINGRSVKCDILKQPIDDVLSNKSLIAQFCAVDLKIDENRIDVNVHPTKNSVLFLERDEIIEEIKMYIDKLVNEMFGNEIIAKCAENCEEEEEEEEADSRVVSMLNIPQIQPIHQIKSIESVRRASPSIGFRKNEQNEKKRVDYMEIRTDSRERKLDEFIIRCPSSQTPKSQKINDGESIDDLESTVGAVADADAAAVASSSSTATDFQNVSMVSILSQENCDDETKTRREFDFESLNELRAEICRNTSLTLREMFKTFTFVGCIDPERVLIQFGTSLYQIELQIILREFFYQMGIFSFGNYGSYRIEDDPPKIIDLLELLGDLAEKESDNYRQFSIFSNSEKRKEAEKLLGEHLELLNDYFSINLEWIGEEPDYRLHVTGIPSLVHYYIPQLEKLPFLIGSLIMDVDYDQEKKCFESICRAIAEFFTFHKAFLNGENEDDKEISIFSPFSWKKLVRQILMPLVKRKFLPPENLKEQNAIKQLADAHDLYKVFERCGS